MPTMVGLRSILGRAARTQARQAHRVRTCSSSPSTDKVGAWHNFWSWTTQQRPGWRDSPKEAAIIFVVFGVTGSTSVAIVRPTLKATTGIEGSLIKGPNSYRVMSILAVSPIYACMLVSFGTLAGRHRYFAAMSHKIFGRFLPSSVLDGIAATFKYCVPRTARR